MIGTHVTLRAGARQARDSHRTDVPRVAGGTVSNGAVIIGTAHTVALLAAARHRRSAFRLHKGMRRAARPSGLISLRKAYLLGREALLAVNGGPSRRGVAAAKKLLVDSLVAAPAVARRQLGGDHKTVMILFLLAPRGLVAIETSHVLTGVHAHLVFVHHRILRPGMALRTLPGGAYQICSWLLCLCAGPCSVDEKRRQHEREGDDHGHENRSKRHGKAPLKGQSISDIERGVHGFGPGGGMAVFSKGLLHRFC